MKLNSKGRFAVTALVDITMTESNKFIKLIDISNRHNISLSFLEQIFNKLKKKGIVFSNRGRNGGYKLAKDASKIKISDVIEAINEKVKITMCNDVDLESASSQHSSKCPTHNLWAGLGDHIFFFLNSISLEDVKLNRLNPIVNSINSKTNETNFIRENLVRLS